MVRESAKLSSCRTGEGTKEEKDAKVTDDCQYGRQHLTQSFLNTRDE